jgi:hypothetical protein
MSETQVLFICLQPKIQERATRHTPTRAMAPLTHVNSDKIEVRLPCLISDLLKGMGMLLTKN